MDNFYGRYVRNGVGTGGSYLSVVLRYHFSIPLLSFLADQFSASGRPKPAQTLLASLPLDFASSAAGLHQGSDEEPYQATEFMHYRKFFSVWEVLERCVEVGNVDLSLTGSRSSRESKILWGEEYKVIQGSQSFLKLISSDRLSSKRLERW